MYIAQAIHSGAWKLHCFTVITPTDRCIPPLVSPPRVARVDLLGKPPLGGELPQCRWLDVAHLRTDNPPSLQSIALTVSPGSHEPTAKLLGGAGIAVCRMGPLRGAESLSQTLSLLRPTLRIRTRSLPARRCSVGSRLQVSNVTSSYPRPLESHTKTVSKRCSVFAALWRPSLSLDRSSVCAQALPCRGLILKWVSASDPMHFRNPSGSRESTESTHNAT